MDMFAIDYNTQWSMKHGSKCLSITSAVLNHF